MTVNSNRRSVQLSSAYALKWMPQKGLRIQKSSTP